MNSHQTLFALMIMLMMMIMVSASPIDSDKRDLKGSPTLSERKEPSLSASFIIPSRVGREDN
ncbi:hypothetical protein C1645_880555 [Glomus cerebriforme]|uniref:Uncharacterized protein n=1 Tax=Glomus cerebriforme TaxID=658196 RepID=A0A397SL70_9GLOM|nr:hypothetical protein C1645_880555 [Glomus cerebriforme]